MKFEKKFDIEKERIRKRTVAMSKMNGGDGGGGEGEGSADGGDDDTNPITTTTTTTTDTTTTLPNTNTNYANESTSTAPINTTTTTTATTAYEKFKEKNNGKTATNGAVGVRPVEEGANNSGEGVIVAGADGVRPVEEGANNSGEVTTATATDENEEGGGGGDSGTVTEHDLLVEIQSIQDSILMAIAEVKNAQNDIDTASGRDRSSGVVGGTTVYHWYNNTDRFADEVDCLLPVPYQLHRR